MCFSTHTRQWTRMHTGTHALGLFRSPEKVEGLFHFRRPRTWNENDWTDDLATKKKMQNPNFTLCSLSHIITQMFLRAFCLNGGQGRRILFFWSRRPHHQATVLEISCDLEGIDGTTSVLKTRFKFGGIPKKYRLDFKRHLSVNLQQNECNSTRCRSTLSKFISLGSYPPPPMRSRSDPTRKRTLLPLGCNLIGDKVSSMKNQSLTESKKDSSLFHLPVRNGWSPHQTRPIGTRLSVCNKTSAHNLARPGKRKLLRRPSHSMQLVYQPANSRGNHGGFSTLRGSISLPSAEEQLRRHPFRMSWKEDLPLATSEAVKCARFPGCVRSSTSFQVQRGNARVRSESASLTPSLMSRKLDRNSSIIPRRVNTSQSLGPEISSSTRNDSLDIAIENSKSAFSPTPPKARHPRKSNHDEIGLNSALPLKKNRRPLIGSVNSIEISEEEWNKLEKDTCISSLEMFQTRVVDSVSPEQQLKWKHEWLAAQQDSNKQQEA